MLTASDLILLVEKDAPIIMVGVTILALISYWLTPEEAWLPRKRITHFIESKGIETIITEAEEVRREE
jgi:hypothetical protein